MNKQTTEKQIIHWNVQTLNHLTAIVDLVNRKQQNKPIHSYDFKLRDFYFRPNFNLFKYKDTPSFIEISSQWIKHFVSYNQLAFLQSISFEHQMEKHRFWNKIYDMYVKSKKDHQNRSVVRNIVWTYRLIPITMFLFGAVTTIKMTGISKMSPRKQLVGLFVAAVMGDFFVRAKKSSDIFYFIPHLSDQKLEQQRIQIMNKSIVLDGKINEIEFHPQYINQLIDQADKEQNYEQKKLILQAGGYIVVDKVDFQY